MMVSTKGRYALRLMVDLALHDNGKFIALKDVSARQKISIKYLEQIVTPLNRAGLLKSGRGAQGGYRLAKNTTDYTVGEILRVAFYIYRNNYFRLSKIDVLNRYYSQTNMREVSRCCPKKY